MVTEIGLYALVKHAATSNNNGLWSNTKKIVRKIAPMNMLTGGFFAGDAAYRYASGDSSLGGALAGGAASYTAWDKLDKALGKLRGKVKNKYLRGALWLPQQAVNMVGSTIADSVAETAANKFIPLHRRKLTANTNLSNNNQEFMHNVQDTISRNNKLTRFDNIAGTDYSKNIPFIKTSELQKIAKLSTTLHKTFSNISKKLNKFKNKALSSEAMPYYIGGGIGIGLGTHWGNQSFDEKQRGLNEQTKFINQYRQQMLQNNLPTQQTIY